MSLPTYRIRRIYVRSDFVPTPDQVAAATPKPEVPASGPGHEPQTPQEMVQYLNAKAAGTLKPVALTVAVPRPVAKAPVKRHQVMPKQVPAWVAKAREDRRARRNVELETIRLRESKAKQLRDVTAQLRSISVQPVAVPRVLKVKSEDGTVHTGKSLREVAKKILRPVKPTAPVRKQASPVRKAATKKGR